MPLVVLAVSLLSLATLFAMVGHCNSDLKTLVACGLYTLGGECTAIAFEKPWNLEHVLIQFIRKCIL